MSEKLGGGRKSPEVRDDLVRDFDNQVVEHLARIERLQTEYDMPFEFLEQMYGDEVVNPAEQAAEAVERWLAFLDLLKTTDKKMVAVSEVHKELRPGCYGFGARAKYDAYGHILIITNPNKAHVFFEVEKKGVSAVLEAKGFVMDDGNSFNKERQYDSFEAPRDIEQLIAAIPRNTLPSEAYDLLEVTAAADTFDELYERMYSDYMFSAKPDIRTSDIMTVGAFTHLSLEGVFQDACDKTGRDLREERRIRRQQLLEK
jgi:hypothetical protein